MTAHRNWPPQSLPVTIHASAVSVGGQGLLLHGPAGSGKSSFALQMMAFGAALISDDLVTLDAQGGGIMLKRPETAPDDCGIEARGLGILRADWTDAAPLSLIVDMGTGETARLPEPQYLQLASTRIRVLNKVDNPAFPAMVLQYFRQPER
ncbi:serine kinase [Aliishimia ponticola]|uniref:Serine kinase n=1 Tax=Aliishimia ponticola TaxID=2499833 RepID=A0A4S4N7A9_9RHOB|nr:serine kinase [Aliishimia ponticola]THH35036.1 serine kinase [Aliishimia ponticola]